MAHILKKKKEHRILSRLSVDGKEIIDKTGIKTAFLEFYSKLYNKSYTDPENLQNYIKECKIQRLTEEEKNLLEKLLL